MTNDSGKKPCETFCEQCGDCIDCYGDTECIDGGFHSVRKQIESPCENCNKVHKSNNLTYFTCQAQVEDILYHTSRELEEAKTEITRLKKQLEMCKEVLAYYANKNNWDEPRQQTTGIIQLSKINQSDFEDTGNGEGYYIAGKRARECLAKLEKE